MLALFELDADVGGLGLAVLDGYLSVAHALAFDEAVDAVVAVGHLGRVELQLKLSIRAGRGGREGFGASVGRSARAAPGRQDRPRLRRAPEASRD